MAHDGINRNENPHHPLRGSSCVTPALAGYGLGLPLVGYGMYDDIEHRFDLVHQFIVGGHFNYVGSLCRRDKPGGSLHQLALSNYLMQTLICTTLFEGWGFGLYGRLDRLALLGVVASVWLVQLALSPLWLRHFRFGPMEWLWRSLTYWRIYPMRVAGEPAA
jgi:uncharacterized protein